MSSLVTNAWYRRLVLAAAAVSVVLASWVALGVPIDMSFGPTFSTEPEFVEPTDAHRALFGAGGSTDVVLLVDVGDLSDRRTGLALADLATELGGLDAVAAVTDPTDLTLFDDRGRLVPRSLRDRQGRVLDEPAYGKRIQTLYESAPLRDLVISDDLATVVVAATLANADDFADRRDGVGDVTAVVDAWSDRTGYDVAVTGFPEIESVYAREIMRSVLLVIAVLYIIVSTLLLLYVRNVRLTAIVISGVTLAMPMSLAAMRLLGQPFSIVNSQVLTLVAIVGIAHALHQVDGYRKSRLAGASHRDAAAHAAETLTPSIATGLTTVAGFLALAAATMPAVRSFGFSTAAGVGIVYALNATLIPVFLEAMADREISSRAPLADGIARLLDFLSALGRNHARTVVTLFLLTVAAFSLFGIPRLSIDQRVSEELPASHPTHQAQVLHETELSGYLGPNLWIHEGPDVAADPVALAGFVNALCSFDGVLHVASPLDLAPQQPADWGETCTRAGVDVSSARSTGQTNGLIGANVEDGITVRVRTSDFGTDRALDLLDEIEDLAAITLPAGVEVDPVGDWVLAQNGMNQLARDVGLSAGFALLVVLPMIGLALRNLKMILASLLPTVLPVIATLAFLGAAGITLRIGTAMILAICLGLAADDTIYLFTDVKRRIAAGDHPSDAMQHALTTSGPPAFFSSLVLVAGLLSMTLNQLLVLRDMGIVAAFTMTFAVLCDLLLGPAMYHLLHPARVEVEVEAAPATPHFEVLRQPATTVEIAVPQPTPVAAATVVAQPTPFHETIVMARPAPPAASAEPAVAHPMPVHGASVVSPPTPFNETIRISPIQEAPR